MFGAHATVHPVSDDLTLAWQRAFLAPVAERGAWRVLADMLLAEGDPRGEWVQLELDAEEGTLKGLARGRLTEVRERFLPRLLPPGVAAEDARTWRGVLVGCRLQVSKAQQPDDPRWRTVRHLSFFFEPRITSTAPWRQTPLGGSQLWWLETLAEVEVETLPLLVAGPVLPRLRRIWWTWPLGRPQLRLTPADFLAQWGAVLDRHRGVRELSVGWAGPLDVAAPFLEGLLGRDLERLGVEGTPTEVLDFDRWVRASRFRGEFVVELRQESFRRATVTVGRDELVLRCDPRVAPQVLARLREEYASVGRAAAPMRVEPPLEGQLPYARPR